MTNGSKKEDLKYGLDREPLIKILLEAVFNKRLIHSHGQFSPYDFYDTKKQYIFEVKHYRYAYNKYQTEIIGVNKGITENGILIFQHEEKDTYFIRYNRKLFNTFNTRFISTSYRMNSVLCFDIPKKYLTKIDLLNPEQHKLISVKGETIVVKKIITDDIMTNECQGLIII